MPNLVIGLTGASGIIYGLKLIEIVDLLKKKYSEIFVIYTQSAEKVAEEELGIKLGELLDNTPSISKVYTEFEIDSPLASSSRLINTDMVIVPASLNTIAKISNGIQENLLLRVASSILRLRGKLIIVPRETPLSTIDLRNMYELSMSGAIIMPASPAYYHRPEGIDDLINFIVGKILDLLGVDHSLYAKWKSLPQYEKR